MKTQSISIRESKPNLTYESTENISKERTECRTNRKCRNNYNATSSDDDEREFEKFIAQTTNYSNESDNNNENDIDNKHYQPNKLIKNLLKPKISRLTKYKSSLSITLNKAKKAYTTFITDKEKNEKNSIKYKNKRERLISIFNELRFYEGRLDDREEKIMKIKNEIERKNNRLFRAERQLNLNYNKFNSYIEYKQNELKQQQDNNDIDKANNDNRIIDMNNREQEFQLRDSNIALLRSEIVKKETEYNIMKPKNNERNNKIISSLVDNQETLKKDVERLRNKAMTQFDEAELDHLNNEIVYKKEEVELLNKQLIRFDNQAKNQYQIIFQRLAAINKGQTELAKLKRELQSKLYEVEKKLNETKTITKRLKEKSEFINNVEKKKQLTRLKRYTYEISL